MDSLQYTDTNGRTVHIKHLRTIGVAGQRTRKARFCGCFVMLLAVFVALIYVVIIPQNLVWCVRYIIRNSETWVLALRVRM